MEKYTCIWLDHRSATILSIVGETESKHVIESGVELRRRMKRKDEQYSHTNQPYIAPGHRLAERKKHQLARYYQEICTYVEDASDIMILGPGVAKTELEKRIEDQPSFAGKLQLVESAGRLTQNQVAARLREFTAKRRAFKHPLAHPYAL
jgi:stalled ribosome rescue protein Dom34